MGKLDKNRYDELIIERIISTQYSHNELAGKLGLTKEAFSKIIHNKQKLYLNDFIDLAYELNLINAKAKRSLAYSYLVHAPLEKYIEILSSSQWNHDLYMKACREMGFETTTPTTKVIQVAPTVKKVPATPDEHLYEEANKILKDVNKLQDILGDYSGTYSDDDLTPGEQLVELLKDISKKLSENSSQFDTESYLEYIHLKNNAYMIENQYVFNIEQITPKEENK